MCTTRHRVVASQKQSIVCVCVCVCVCMSVRGVVCNNNLIVNNSAVDLENKNILGIALVFNCI